MQITRQNILIEYPQIKQNILPDNLKQAEFDFLAENMDLYGEDATIDEFIDTFISKLNEVLAKKTTTKTTTTKAKAKKTTAKTTTTKTKFTSKKSSSISTKRKATKTNSKTTSNKRKTTKTTAKANQVNNVDLQISILKSFYLMTNKTVPKSRVLTLYRKIEKAALEKTIRKKGKYAKYIEDISKVLAEELNKGKENITITINEDDKKILKELAYSEKQMVSVRLLKRFAYLIGKEEKGKAQRLLNAISRAFEKSEVTQNNPYYVELVTAQSLLLKYLETKKPIKMSQSELNGLGSIIGHEVQDDIEEDWLDEITQTDSKKKNIINKDFVKSSDLKGIYFDTLEFDNEWLELIGEPSNPFYFMIFGSPGSGKSSMSLQFAKYLAAKQNLKVGYFAKEEGISKTIQEKLDRFDAYDDNLFIIENLPENLIFLMFYS